jgi:hypothetical protein
MAPQTITRAFDAAGLLCADLRIALAQSTAIEALLLLPMIADAEALRSRLNLLIGAMSAKD